MGKFLAAFWCRRQLWGVLFWLLVLLVCLLLAQTSHAATNQIVKLRWSLPDSGGTVASYQFRAVDDLGVQFVPLVYADTLMTQAPVPAAKGAQDSAYAFLPRGPGMMIWVVCVGSTGLRSDSSNAVVGRCGGRPDTNYVDISTVHWFKSDSRGTAFYSRSFGDNRWLESRVAGRPWKNCPLIASQEDVQRQDKVECCKIWTYWCLRGGHLPCN